MRCDPCTIAELLERNGRLVHNAAHCKKCHRTVRDDTLCPCNYRLPLMDHLLFALSLFAATILGAILLWPAGQ